MENIILLLNQFRLLLKIELGEDISVSPKLSMSIGKGKASDFNRLMSLSLLL